MIEETINNTKSKIKSSIDQLHNRLSGIIATGAHPSLLKDIEVMYYEALTPLNQVANIGAPDATMLIVTPFDKAVNKDIIEAIHKSSLDFNPVDEGDQIRIMIPPMTSEKRDIFVKESKKIGEEAKIAVRNIRQEAIKKIRANDEISKDQERNTETDIQTIIDDANKEIDNIVKTKIDELTNI